MRLPHLSLTTQIVALLAATLAVAQALNLYLLIGERQATDRDNHYRAVIERMVDVAVDLPDEPRRGPPRELRAGPGFSGAIFLSGNERSRLLPDALPAQAGHLRAQLEAAGVAVGTVSAATRSIDADPSGRPPPRGGRAGPGAGPPLFHPRTPPDRSGQPGPGLEEVVFSAELAPGVWLNAMAPYYSQEVLTNRALYGTLLTLCVAILAAALLARYITRPLQALADAAETLGRGGAALPVAERGPADVQATARAFNLMQARLIRVIDEQRATLRALGHDLRTPLTALRLRIEALPGNAERDRLNALVDRVQGTTEEILSWARDATAEEATAPTDLTTLLEVMAADYAEQGADVTHDDIPAAVVVPCRRRGLRRALGNLVDNALKYAGSARLSIERLDGNVLLHVDDDGPGIPAGQMEHAVAPFTRLETSRSRATGGIGLGLSIARSIALAHGGALELANRAEGGLRATITLPEPATPLRHIATV